MFDAKKSFDIENNLVYVERRFEIFSDWKATKNFFKLKIIFFKIKFSFLKLKKILN